MQEVGGGLPSAYQQIEYLESTGTQAILTDIPCQLPIQTDIDIMFVGSQDSYFCGTMYGDIRICQCGNYTSNVQWAFITYKNTPSISVNTRYLLSAQLENGYQKISRDGTTLGTYVLSLNQNQLNAMTGKIALFAMRLNDTQAFGQFAKARCYDMKVQNTSGLIGHFVPCIRKSDSKPGMYDTVSKTFYTNAGTGEFVIPT